MTNQCLVVFQERGDVLVHDPFPKLGWKWRSELRVITKKFPYVGSSVKHKFKKMTYKNKSIFWQKRIHIKVYFKFVKALF